jgi:hypothetical protein
MSKKVQVAAQYVRFPFSMENEANHLFRKPAIAFSATNKDTRSMLATSFMPQEPSTCVTKAKNKQKSQPSPTHLPQNHQTQPSMSSFQ